MGNELIKLLLESDKLVPTIKEYINKYKPMVYELLQEAVEVAKDFSNNTEYPAVIAKTKKNLYDAYVNVGFTEDQALALMINDNIQLLKNIRNTSSTGNKKKVLD